MPTGIYKRNKKQLEELKKRGFQKGFEFTEEHKRKLKEALKGHYVSNKTKEKIRQSNLGKKRSKITKKRISESKTGDNNSRFWKGKKFTEEHIEKLKVSHQGQKSHLKGKKRPAISNNNNPNWKGDDVGYRALHNWIIKQKGKASDYQCEHCDKQARHWANKKHDYKRILDDYMALCVSCHRKYDNKNN